MVTIWQVIPIAISASGLVVSVIVARRAGTSAWLAERDERHEMRAAIKAIQVELGEAAKEIRCQSRHDRAADKIETISARLGEILEEIRERRHV